MFVFGPVVGGIHGYSYRPGGFHKTYKNQWKPHHGPLSWIQVRCLRIFVGERKICQDFWKSGTIATPVF